MKRSVFWLSPLAWASVAALAQTLPTGGTITQGSGSIAVNGATTLVQQNSPRMVADWQSFSIGAGGTVRFVQPSTASVALNRVLGSDPSLIFGNLTANGHVFLTNPNGVLFAPGAQVDVGSLVATSLNADVSQFMAGQLRLSGGAGAGAVRNEGRISVAPGGFVVLAAPQVANAGSIVAPGGTAALAAGSAVEVDPMGSGLLSIRVPASAVNAKLTQSGSIVADGGRVSLQAAATDAALNTVMQVSGVVRARSIEQRDGQIVLSGGSSGVVRVDGTLDASGGAGVQGGTVKVLGERVALLDGAQVDASGGDGGGRVLVGGAFQGLGPEPNARDTYVARGAVLDASARERGQGGQVVVWADGSTTYRGRIVADGGALQGDGGQVEVSGKRWLDFDGDVSLLAPRGRRGTLLLDPSNLDVGLVADVNGDNTTGDDLPGSFLASSDFAGATSRITATRVASLLTTGSVQLQAGNSLTVSAPLTVAAGGASSTLSLQAPSVSIGAPISLANSSLLINTAQSFSDSISVNADVQSLASISLTSSDIFIGATVTAPSVTLAVPAGASFGGAIGQSATSGIVAGTLALQRGGTSPSTVVLNGTGNRVGTLDLAVSQADITISNPAGTPVAVQGNVAGGGSLNVALTLSVSGGMTQGAASALSVTGTTSLIATGADAVTLTNPANAFSGTVSFNAGGNVSLAAQGRLSATGTAAGNIALQAVGGPFVLPNPGITTTGATSTIDITGAGFIDATDAAPRLVVQPGGRYFIRSSDFSTDFLGGIAFGTGAADINSIVLAGWTGAPPATGNVYFTNATGSIATPATDVAAVSKVYDGTTAFTYNQTGGAATGTFGLSNSVIVTAYSVTAPGNFADKNAGTDKAYAVAPSGNSIATGSAGELYFGLGFAGSTRPAFTGGALSQVTPRPLATGGVTAVDRAYDGTTAVQLVTSGLTLFNTVPGDSVSVAGTPTGTMSDKNAGANKPVAIGGLALTGADALNYALTTSSIPVTVNIATLQVQAAGITAADRVVDGTTQVPVNAQGASLRGVLPGDVVTLDASGATGSVASPDPGVSKPVLVSGLVLGGTDALNYSLLATPLRPDGSPLTVRFLSVALQDFENVRNKEYLQGVSDAQEPFRRAMAEALASGFGKENIRKQLGRGLVFETGLAPPAVENIQPARPPSSCTTSGAGLVCGR